MAERLALADDFEISTDSAETQLNNNILVVGASGSGKTMSYAQMRLLRTCESSLVVTLSKRSLARTYLRHFEDKGYRVLDLNLTCPEHGTCFFDPMRYVRSVADITYLARSIVMANPRKSNTTDADPFWDDAAISLLCALIAYEMHVRSRPSFADVADRFSTLRLRDRDGMVETSLDGTFERLEREQPGGFATECWKTFRFTPMRTAGCIYAALSAAMDTIFTPQIRNAMRERPCADFEDLACEKSVLFVTTSAVNPSLNAFAGILYSQAVKELFEYAESLESGELPIPVHLLCDDFAVGAQIPNFAQYISIFREKRLSVSILLQSESQLAAMYGKHDATTIINNCDRYVYMGGMDLSTCRHIATRADIPLADVLYMPLGQQIIFQRGSRPIVTRRFSIMEDDAWKSVQAGGT